jgi:drug/metabolite transporter (DMT)-like permease
VLFKLFDKRQVNTLQAIIVNYFTAFACGFVLYEGTISVSEITTSKWFTGAVLLGLLFITIFNLMALTAQRNGVSVASVAAKMSVIIPVIFGIYVYNESTGFFKLLGIFLALFAVYLTAYKTNIVRGLRHNLSFPFMVFLGSGIIDTSIKYIEINYVPPKGIPIFSGTIFLIAGVLGLVFLMIKNLNKKVTFDPKSLIGGLLLGIVNYCSIYFLLKALQLDNLESSTIFTVNNVAIVMVSTLVGLWVFKEHISRKNWIGISMAIISIYLVTLA